MSLRLPAVALGVALSMAAPSGLDAARVGAESQDPGIADRDTVRIPSSLREEHEEIRRDLDRAMLEPGRTGEAARAGWITSAITRSCTARVTTGAGE